MGAADVSEAADEGPGLDRPASEAALIASQSMMKGLGVVILLDLGRDLRAHLEGLQFQFSVLSLLAKPSIIGPLTCAPLCCMRVRISVISVVTAAEEGSPAASGGRLPPDILAARSSSLLKGPLET